MQAIKLIWLKLFNTELCPKRCWRGPKPQEVGKTEEQYTVHCLTVHCHHRIDFCIQMSSDKNNFNVSLIVRGKVTRRRPQTTIFKERGAPKRYRTEVLLFTSLTPTAKPGRLTTGQHYCLISSAGVRVKNGNLRNRAFNADRLLRPGVQKLCESRDGRPGLPVPNSPYGFYGRKASLKKKNQDSRA